jgi:anaerobic selenocysteine-containing dehydrogenase
MVDRREFIKTSAALGAGVMLGTKWQQVWAYSQSPNRC